ncbi:oligosaccharide flippase family protein [Rhodococcus sp. NPDC059234]|uniref:oligosaccharide flippase family protein n=1 Tax=Rhodococcus sp. NPDC059234 TaxID=3346781 RepID=UPI00366DA80D
MTAGDEEAPARTFGSVLKRGAAMAAAGTVVVQTVTIVQTLVLGRLLGPEEVGVYAAGTAMMGFLVVFTHGTLCQALIQREHDVEDAANTVLVATFCTGLVMGLAVLAASPLIGAMFEDSRVGLVAAVSSGTIVLHACSSVPDALMQRAFKFERRIVIDPVVGVTFAVVSIAFGAQGFGAWAMVIGSYASIVVWVVMSWWLARWRPFRGRISFRIWREMAGFSLPLLVDGLVVRGREFLELVLIGRALDTAALGNYRYGYRIAMMPVTAVVQVCSYVLFPAFSRIYGDRDRFRGAFLRALGWIWLAAVPIAALMVAVGEPLVVLLLGEPWRGAGVAVATMPGLGLGAAMNSVTAEAMKGAGRSSRLLWMTAVGVVVGLPLLVVLLRFGLAGVGLAISIGYLAAGFVGLALARRVVDVSISDIVACMAPSTIAAAVALAVIAPFEHLVLQSDQYSAPVGLALIALDCTGFLLIFVAVLRLTSPVMYGSLLNACRRMVTQAAALIRPGR